MTCSSDMRPARGLKEGVEVNEASMGIERERMVERFGVVTF